MNPSKYMDKRVTQLSTAKTQCFVDDDDDDDDQTFDFHPFRSSSSYSKSLHSSQLRGWSSLDGIDSEKNPGQRGGVSSNTALILEIDGKMKEHTDVLLHSVECLSARLTQVEGRTREVESVFVDLKNLIEFHHGRNDRKMKVMENIMLEVQDGIKDLKDKQEIAETQLQLQLAKLQVSKDGAQLGEKSSTVQASSVKEAISSVSQQFSQPVTPQVVNPQQPHVPYYTVANVPPQSHHPTMIAPAKSAAQLPTPATAHPSTFAGTSPLPPFQSPQNIIHSVLPQESYYAPHTAYQQFNMPSAQQPHSSSPHHQTYGLPANLPPNSQLPQLPQLQPPRHATNPQFHHQSGPQAESMSYTIQKSSQPLGLSSTGQFNVGFTQLSGDQPPNKHQPESVSTNLKAQGVTPHGQLRVDDFYRCGVSPAHSDIITQTFRPSSLPHVQDDDSTRSQLPTARVLPYAIPTASALDSESNSGGGGNSGQVDDVIDKVVGMGFRRDLARATVKKLTENGQSVDLNLVLDKLMNNG